MAPSPFPTATAFPLRAAFPVWAHVLHPGHRLPTGFPLGGRQLPHHHGSPAASRPWPCSATKSFVAGGTYGQCQCRTCRTPAAMPGHRHLGKALWQRRAGGRDVRHGHQPERQLRAGGCRRTVAPATAGWHPASAHWVQTDGDGISGGCEDTLTVVTDTVFFQHAPRSPSPTCSDGPPVHCCARWSSMRWTCAQSSASRNRPARADPGTEPVLGQGDRERAWHGELAAPVVRPRGRQVLQWTSQGVVW